MDLPPFDRSQMDGFAVKNEDVKNAPVKLKIIGESVAGIGFDGEMKTGEAVRIMTGARVPAGADSVQKVELTEEIGRIYKNSRADENKSKYSFERRGNRKGSEDFQYGRNHFRKYDRRNRFVRL